MVLRIGLAALAIISIACDPVPPSVVRMSPRIDAQLAAQIASIKAIDNHAHPVRPVAAGETPDSDYDALPVEHLEPSTDPVRTRPGAAEIAAAHAALASLSKAPPADLLDFMGIDIMLANRVSMGPALPPQRFLWVPYADAFLYPLSNQSMIGNPDQKAFFELEEKLLRRYYSDAGLNSRPDSLEDYLTKVVRATLVRQHAGGAIAEKFEMAYLRPLAVENPSRADAEAAWAGKGDYKHLQDFLFLYIASTCGELGMAVHIHVAAGAGSYFNVAGTNPLLLEPLLDDPHLRRTNFVLLHGAWPFTREVAALLQKPNAFLDFSAQTYFNYPDEVAQVLRSWLELVPEKVLFATDGYPYSAESGWAETAYLANATGREALAIALTGMLRDGEIDRARALQLARLVLRDNARALYKLN